MSVITTWRRPQWPVLAIGLLLLFIGFLWSSAGIMAFLQPANSYPAQALLAGASLFRLGCVMAGVLVIWLGGLPIWNQPPAQAARPAEPNARLINGALLVLLILSFLLRLYQLNVGLWIDEILTYMNYARLPMGEVISKYASENQHFLFSILARICFVAFGESTWALRLPAVVFGVGSIWALFLFGRYVSGAREGLLTAALLAFSYHHVWFSQNARGYTGLLFWAMLSSWLLLRAMDLNRPQAWLWYGVSAALGMYTHMTMMFVIFGQLVVYGVAVWQQRLQPRWYGFWLGFGVGGFLTFWLFSLALPQIFTTVAGTQSVVAAWRSPLWTLLELVNGVMVTFAGGMAVIGAIAGVVAVVLFGAGVWGYWRQNTAVLYLLFLPAVVGGGLTILMGHHLWPRFFFFSFGFAALVLVRGVLVTATWLATRIKPLRQRAETVGLAVCLGMILVSAVSVAFAYGPKQDYEAAIAYIEAHQQPGDAVAAVSIAANIYRNFYEVDWQAVESVADLDQIRAGATRTWMVYTFKPVVESVYPEIMTEIQTEFEVVQKFPGSVRQGTVFVAVVDGS